jgi:hypothetical protein
MESVVEYSAASLVSNHKMPSYARLSVGNTKNVSRYYSMILGSRSGGRINPTVLEDLLPSHPLSARKW